MSLYNRSREELERTLPQALYVNDEAILVRCLNSYVVWALCGDESVTPSLVNHGYWESWITSWFTHNVKEGDFLVDVGANCGYYTMLFETLVGKSGRVVAYEASPVYARLLKGTRFANSANFRIHSVALADAEGELTLTYPGDHTGSASIVGTPFDEKWGEPHSVTVPTSTLDWDFEGVDTPDIIKIDAESAEEMIWNGGQELLNRHDAPVVVMEYSPTDTYSKEFPHRLFEYGDVTRIGTDGKEYPINVEYLNNLTDWSMIVIRKKW